MLKRIYKSLKSIWAQRQLRKAQLSQAISHTRETIEDTQDDLTFFKENFVAIHYNKEMGIFIGRLLLELSLFPLIKSYLKTPNSASQEESTDSQCLESEESTDSQCLETKEYKIETNESWGNRENIILSILFGGAINHTTLVMKLIYNYVCYCSAITRAIKVQLTTVQADEIAETAFNIETNRYELEPALEDTEGAEVRFKIIEAKVSEEAHEGIEEDASTVSVAEEELIEGTVRSIEATAPRL